MKDLKQIIKAANSLEPVELPLDFMPNLMEKIENISSNKSLHQNLLVYRLYKKYSVIANKFYYHNKRAFIAVAVISHWHIYCDPL